MSLLAQLDRIPPCVCRLLARSRNGKRGLSDRDIAKASGLPRTTVQDLSWRTSWGTVQFSIAERFSQACGVDLGRPARAIAVLRQGASRGFWHVSHAPTQRRAFYHRLIQLMRSKSK